MRKVIQSQNIQECGFKTQSQQDREKDQWRMCI